MGRGDGTEYEVHGGDGTGADCVHAGASDARLAELLRGETPTAYPALRELRSRHQPALLDYARLCAAGESAARQLAAAAFSLAARHAARGTDSGGPWRHQLLVLAGRSRPSGRPTNGPPGSTPACCWY